jgi:hypothetical protein
VAMGAHRLHPLASNPGSEHRTKSISPVPYGLMDDLDPPLVQQVLDVSQRQREAEAEHHRQADDQRACLEVAEGGAWALRKVSGASWLPQEMFL